MDGKPRLTLSCPSDVITVKVYRESETTSMSGTREHSSRYHTFWSAAVSARLKSRVLAARLIKRVRLDYKPVAKRTSEEAAFVVSAEHVAAVNRSIEKKLKKNKRDRRESEKEAGKYLVT